MTDGGVRGGQGHARAPGQMNQPCLSLWGAQAALVRLQAKGLPILAADKHQQAPAPRGGTDFTPRRRKRVPAAGSWQRAAAAAAAARPHAPRTAAACHVTVYWPDR